MLITAVRRWKCFVALLTEGVDRNTTSHGQSYALPSSPSSRRAWIEIALCADPSVIDVVALLTEGVDRNVLLLFAVGAAVASPSSRRAWIEIKVILCASLGVSVALLTEGVDRNSHEADWYNNRAGRPPHGGRG